MPGHGTDSGGDRAPQRRQGSELTPEERAALAAVREAKAEAEAEAERRRLAAEQDS